MSIRASDADRDRAMAALQRHTGAGRLTLDEFGDRVRLVCDARTVEELTAALHDLPPDQEHRRELLWLFAVAAAALILLFAFVAATR